MNFVAIDFETANEQRNSACSLGLCLVENNRIIEKKYWLIKPPEMRFEKANIWIHGIYPEDVEKEKTFNEIWHEIRPYLENNLVIAHNASFDISVLRRTLEYYNIGFPKCLYGCTLILARNHYREVANYKLNTIANSIGYKFNHHNAVEDAEAAARIMLDICKRVKINDLASLSFRGGIKLGELYYGGYESCKSLIKNEAIEKDLSIYKDMDFNEDFFHNKVVVFTGPLESMKRHEAMEIVRRMGGTTGGTVTKKTTCLVTGVKNRERLTLNYKSTKLRRAEALIEAGQKIEIITEEQFLKIIK